MWHMMLDLIRWWAISWSTIPGGLLFMGGLVLTYIAWQAFFRDMESRRWSIGLPLLIGFVLIPILVGRFVEAWLDLTGAFGGLGGE